MLLLMLEFGYDIETKVQVLKPQMGQIKVHVLKLMFGQNFELQFKHLGLLCLSQCCLCQKQNTVTIVSACMLSQTKTSHNSVYEATFLLTFHCPVAVVKKCILFKERKEKVSFKEKLSCSSGFTRRREQIRPKSPLSNQGFNLFQSPQISTPCQLERHVSLIAFENSSTTITI